MRTFGGWRERRGFGLAGLTGPQTGAALIGVLACLGVVMVQPAALVVIAIPMLAAVGLVGVRVRGESLWSVLHRRGRWVWARQRGHTSFRGAAGLGLPGELAGARVIEVEDPHGDRLGVVWDESRRMLTAMVPLEPLGMELVSAEQGEQWACAWGDWLSHLGYVPALRHAAVTVHTGPDPPRPSPQSAGGIPAAVLQEVAQLGSAAAWSRTIVSLTVDCAAGLEAGCADLLEVLSGASALARCGATVLPALRPEEIAGWVRFGYDPGSRPVTGSPEDMGPSATEEAWDCYRHDGAFSAGFVWSEPPAMAVAPDVLTRLLGPSQYHKRVTLVFEPLAAHDAAREVERQAEAAVFRREYRRRLGRDETARDRVDLERARRTADEQARGAGVVDVGMYAVISAPSTDQLRLASNDLENRAGESRLRLRRNYGAQSATFATTLGIGYVPPRRW